MNNIIKKIRHTIIPAVYLILERDNKILMIRRFNTGHEDGKYSLVAGHVDAGETFIQTMVREAAEEAGIQIAPVDLYVVHVLHRLSPVDAEERVDTFFKARAWVGEPKNVEPNKCDDMTWIDYDALPKNTVPWVRFVLEKIKSGIFYSEFGW